MLTHVADSDTLVIFQSEEVLRRPWCLVEVYTAVQKGIPIVSLICANKGYDYADAADTLLNLDTAIPLLSRNNMKDHGADPLRVAHVQIQCPLTFSL